MIIIDAIECKILIIDARDKEIRMKITHSCHGVVEYPKNE
jgi:hypothetical protein